MKNFLLTTLIATISFSTHIQQKASADIVLADKNIARVAIHVEPDVMAPNKPLPGDATFAATEAETQRRRLRESVNDLALYLEKMSGAEVGVLQRTPTAQDKLTPIFIGEYARQKFGEPKQKALYQQGFRIVVSRQGIGLLGESDESTSYAIYTLLDQLGCRWFMPSEMGEVVPRRSTLRLPETDVSSAPSTAYRGVWAQYADEDFRRRSRMGGFIISASHALEGHISKEQREAHPDWRAIINGKPHPTRLKWSKQGVADAIADEIIARLDKSYTPSVSLSPDDGAEFDESEDKALDAGDYDEAAGHISLTDRYIVLCNRIAERVTKKYPDVRFGFLAYAQYTRPPVREKLHPNLVPQIAPITYCRAHAMTDANCPSRQQIKYIVEGWGKAAKQVSYYNYMFHLAEVSSPYPMMHQMSKELPILYQNNITFWQPETMPNFEEVLPGMWLSLRMAWDSKQSPEKVLDEFFTQFYGAASTPMRRYWQTFDDAWTNVPEHAGCAFGYGRRFTPEVLKQARDAMDAALSAANTPMEYRRVKIQDESLRQFERFMQMRRDFFDAKFSTIERDSTRWLGTQLSLGDQYSPQYSFSKVGWTPDTVSGGYFKNFYHPAYLDGARIARDFAIITPSLRKWRYNVDKENKGAAIGWSNAEFDDSEWKTTDPCIDTWDALGLVNYYGSVYYRDKVKVDAAAANKKVFLWISSTDGSAKVFVNGQHIPYVNEKGEKSDTFSGYCQPASFDITAAVKPGADNQITVIGTRLFLNELGTGGLIGPVLVYREK